MDGPVVSSPAPDVAEIQRYLLADQLNREGKADEALGVLRELVDRPSANPHIHAQLGHILLQTGHPAEAEAAFRHAAALDPENDGFRSALAEARNRQGQRADAIRILRALVEKPTPDPNIHAHLGRLLLQSRDYPGAEAALRTAIRIDPTNDSFSNALADALARQGRHDEALTILRERLAGPDVAATTHVQLGHVLLQMGDLVSAEQAFRIACDLDPANDAFRAALAAALNRQGEIEAARTILAELIARPTGNAYIHAQFGHMLLQDAELPAAEQAFARAIALDPENDGFRSALAEARHRNGHTDNAVEILSDLVARPTDDPNIHAHLGRLLRHQGDLAGAEAALRSAAQMNPGAEDISLALADVLSRQDRTDEAIRILRPFAAKPSRNPQLHAQLGHLLLQIGDLDRAEPAFRAALEIAPDDAAIREAIESVSRRRGPAIIAEELGNPHELLPTNHRKGRWLLLKRALGTVGVPG